MKLITVEQADKLRTLMNAHQKDDTDIKTFAQLLKYQHELFQDPEVAINYSSLISELEWKTRSYSRFGKRFEQAYRLYFGKELPLDIGCLYGQHRYDLEGNEIL